MPATPRKTSTLPLPKSPELAIYEAVINHVETSSVLSSVVKRFESTPFNFAPAPVSLLPAIRMEAGAGGLDTRTMDADTNTLLIAFVLEVAQGYHGDLMNLWHALRKRINIHRDDWLALALQGTTGLIYNSMSWNQAAVTYTPVPDSRTLISTAVLAITFTTRDNDPCSTT